MYVKKPKLQYRDESMPNACNLNQALCYANDNYFLFKNKWPLRLFMQQTILNIRLFNWDVLAAMDIRAPVKRYCIL